MSISQIDQLKDWFKTGERPTQDQFWSWLESYGHLKDHFGLDEYDDSHSYNEGDTCWHAGLAYMATQSTTGTFNVGHWDTILIADPRVIKNLQTQLDDLKTLVNYLLTQI